MTSQILLIVFNVYKSSNCTLTNHSHPQAFKEPKKIRKCFEKQTTATKKKLTATIKLLFTPQSLKQT